MNEELTPPASAAWDSERRVRRRWNTAAGAFTIALMSVSGLYWVKNPPAQFTGSLTPPASISLEK